MANEQFIVQVDNGRFLVEFDGNQATVVDTPSKAAHMTYTQADAACQRLRRRGFRQTCVSDITGNPMTFQAIREAADALHAAQTEASLPATLKELDKIPAEVYRKRRRTEPAFDLRAAELERPKAEAR
jgi:hypothetical protein